MNLRPLISVLAGVFISMSAASVTSNLGHHDFMYAGEGKRPLIYIVKDGTVAWSHEAEGRRGEISDAILLTDGNILVAHQYGVMEIAPDHSTVWSYDAPEGTEIHTIQPIGNDKVVFVQNGKPAKVVVMAIPSTEIVSEFTVDVPESASVHGQFRNARLTSKGTLLVSNMAGGYISEYNDEGKEIDRWEIAGPWSCSEVGKAPHLLAVGKKSTLREIDRRGNIISEIKLDTLGITSAQKAVRLKNGNTIVNNWYNEWSKTPLDTLNAPVQAIEITPKGEVVWQLKAWKDPCLGPSTTIQPLDQAVNRQSMFFGRHNGRSPKLFVEPNKPIGKAKGAVPGRVAWIHSPGVARWDGRTGLWVEDRWNNQAKADRLLKETIKTVGGKDDAKAAWKAIFSDFNKRHGKGSKGYRKGEKIAIKLNMNNAITHRDTIELNSSPFVTLALVKTLVEDGGVRPADIIVCEPSRAITDSIYNKIHRLYPDITFIDNIGGDGREKCEYYPERIVYSVDTHF